VLRLDFGKSSFLFVGDAEAHAEARLVDSRAPLRASVLKVGHHGSRTSTSAPFLRAVSPSLAVISAGAGNRHGHPHADVLSRLREAVPNVLSLAETGGVVVTTDGTTLTARSWSGERFGWRAGPPARTPAP
jgi:beta-lactamase superfamily II metal-dependent hydrolase